MATPRIGVNTPNGASLSLSGAHDTASFSVEVPAANLIHAEILTVTSAMRKNQRWAQASFQAFPAYNPQSAPPPPLVGSAGAGRTASFNKELQKARAREARGQRGHGLMGAFAALKMELREFEATSDGSLPFDAVSLLTPFLEVVRSPETSGPITATALSSIDKFLTYSLLAPNSPQLAQAMAALSAAGTHCKFEASDGASDEVVLLKILDVLRNALTGRLGGVLSDESVCEMMETGLSMCCQMRLSEMLRRSAERTMQAMVSAVFSRLRTLPSDAQLPTMPSSAVSLSDSLSHADDQVGLGLRMAAPDPRSAIMPGAEEKASSVNGADGTTVDSSELGAGSVSGSQSTGAPPQLEKLAFENDLLPPPLDEAPLDEDEPTPFGLASIQELLRVLISLLNPHDQQHTDSMRLMALGLLNIAFEVAGQSIGRFPALRSMVSDQLCKHLFQLARSDNLQLLSTSLRVITNIFDTMRPHLRLQQELFLSFLLDRLVQPHPSTAPGTRKQEVEAQLDAATWAADGGEPLPISGKDRERIERERERGGREAGEARELMLDILGHFARGRYDMVDLWVNYDCNVEGEDLAERLVKFFARGVFPQPQGVSYIQDNTQLGCLDTLLGLVANMAARLDEGKNVGHEGPSAEEVAKAKKDKKVLLEGAQQWNLKPKVGLKFLEDHGVIYADPSLTREESLANFLKTTPRLDKKLLGDFISRPEQIELLKAWIRSLDFSGKSVCDAMRDLLEGFRLPGESQQINRITETFAEVFFASGPEEVRSSDAVYVLAYAVIMLNVDQHSPQVRKRMDFEAFAKNLRGVNDGQNFSEGYLKSIYESIKKREIIFPEEHQNALGFEHGWKELLRRSRRIPPFASNRTNEFDRAMFELSWKPIVSAMSYAFANFGDDYMVQRAIGGFNQCATLAARFEMPQVFDYIIVSLSKVTGLTQSFLPTEIATFPVVDVEGQKVTVSPLAVRFGMNVKAQLAAVVLFTIANNNGASIREGWSHIFEIYQTLFVHSLLPAPLLAMEDFLSGGSVIPLKPVQAPVLRDDRRNDGGLLSTLSSYLLSPYGGGNDLSANEFSDDDVETTLSAVDCIASCSMDELYSQIFDLKGTALVAPVQILIDLTTKITIERLRGKQQGGATAPQSPQISITTARHQLPYDPSAVLLLEVLTSIVARADPASIAELWPITFDFLTKLLNSANSFSSLLNERVVAALLRLASVVIKQDALRDSAFLGLDMLRTLSAPVLSSVAEPLMAGLSKLFIENADRIQSTTEWNLIFALFSATINQEEAAKLSFDLMKQLAGGQLGQAGLRPDNYAGFLHVLSAFANTTQGGAAPAGGKEVKADESALQRGRQIVDILRDTQLAIPKLIEQSDLAPKRAWEASWIPLLSAYAQLCLNPSRELRQIAISSLQRTLLAPEILHSPTVDLTIIFERVFFPMLEELLKPQVFRRDPEGMGETRLRASALLCKIFLQYLTQLSERQGMRTMMELWLKILGYQDRFMHSGRRDQMYEAVPESLKNVLLVMNASGFLVPPHVEGRTQDQAILWDTTFERIGPFLPELRAELFPAPRAIVPVPFEQGFATNQQQQQQRRNSHHSQPPSAAGSPQVPQYGFAPQQGQELSQSQGQAQGQAQEQRRTSAEGVESVLGL